MLTWDNQIKQISSKVSNGLRMLYLARKLTDNQETLKTIYYSLVQPYFDYCDVVWGDCSKTRADKLQKLQNRAARIITRADYSIRSSDVLNSLEWSNLEERRKRHLLVTMFKIFNNDCPTYLRVVVLPMMVNTERLRPKGVSFSGFRYMKGLGISLVEVYLKVGKSVIWVCKRAQRG